MKRTTELVVHVGLPHSGGAGLAQALRALRPQLRDRAVAYLPQLSWAKAECRRTATRTGGSQTLLISDETLLGPARPPLGHPPGAPAPWFPQAPIAIGELISALKPDRTTVVLLTRRQDRLLELDYAEELLAGVDTQLADRLADLVENPLDYADLLDRLAGVTGVDRLVVGAYEAAAADRRQLVRLLLGTVGLVDPMQLPIDPVLPMNPVLPAGTPLPLDPTPTARGLAVARAMNTELDTDDERRLVRDFVLTGYAGGPEDPEVLDPAQRRAVITNHAETNRRLFETYLPDIDPTGYAGEDETRNLSLSGAGPVTDLASGRARVGVRAAGFRLADHAVLLARSHRRSKR